MEGRGQPQGWGEIKPGLGYDLALLLHGRNGKSSRVELADGSVVEVVATNWGRDFGEVWEHLYLTTETGDLHFVMSSDVISVVSPLDNAEIYRKKP